MSVRTYNITLEDGSKHKIRSTVTYGEMLQDAIKEFEHEIAKIEETTQNADGYLEWLKHRNREYFADDVLKFMYVTDGTIDDESDDEISGADFAEHVLFLAGEQGLTPHRYFEDRRDADQTWMTR